MKDGMGRKIGNSVKAIKKALKGDTSYVETDDGNTVITYNEEQGEIDISHYDSFVQSFESKQLHESVLRFLGLITRGY